MHQIRFRLFPAFHFLLALLVSGVLVWFDLRPVKDNFAGLGVLLLYGLVSFLGVFAAVKMRRNLRFLSGFAIILLFAVYRSRGLEGRAVLASDDCDFSVCNTFRFGSNGVWRHRFWSQADQRNEIGTYQCRNDSVFLYRSEAHFSFSFQTATALSQQMRKGFVTLVHVDENRRIEELQCADGKWYYSFVPREKAAL